MSTETFAYLDYLSFDMQNPVLGSKAMHTFLCNNIKLNRRVLTKDLLKKLVALGIGTNDVEKYAARMSNQNDRKGRNSKQIRDTMKSKLPDYAEFMRGHNFWRCFSSICL